MMMEEDGIGIVGVSCRYPGGANSTEELWEKLLKPGKHAIKLVPAERWKLGPEDDDEQDHEKKAKADLRVQAAILDDPHMIDPAYFKYDDGEIASMDPHHRLALEVAAQVFHEAGWTKEALMGKQVSIFLLRNFSGSSCHLTCIPLVPPSQHNRLAYLLP